jgi:hypothetical protein
MAEPDTTQIVAGPGLIYIAPLGSSLPAADAHGEYPVTWPVAWLQVGYTDAGIDLNYSPTIKSLRVDELASPVSDVLEEEKFHVMAHLAEVTLLNYSRSISACTYLDDSVAKETIKVSIGSKPLSYVMVGIQGPAPGTNLVRLVIIQKAIANGAVGFKMQRKDKVVFPVQWEARQISGQDLVDIYDLTLGAS